MTADHPSEPNVFGDPEQTGDDLSEQMATITNRALRGRSEKLHQLGEKYKQFKEALICYLNWCEGIGSVVYTI
jgi:hypothetical protein